MGRVGGCVEGVWGLNSPSIEDRGAMGTRRQSGSVHNEPTCMYIERIYR